MFTEENIPKPENKVYFFVDDVLSQNAETVVKLEKVIYQYKQLDSRQALVPNPHPGPAPTKSQ